MDRVAAATGLDPAEVRRRNFVRPDQFPYTSAVGSVYDSGNYQAALDRALALVRYDALREEQARLRTQGRYLGIGMGSYVELTGVGPSRAFGAPVLGERGGARRDRWHAHPDQRCALAGSGPRDQLRPDPRRRAGGAHRQRAGADGRHGVGVTGVGTFSSRSMPVAGGAVALAAARVREKAIQIGAALLEAAPEDVEYRDGGAAVRGAPGKAVTFQAIAQRRLRRLQATRAHRARPRGDGLLRPAEHDLSVRHPHLRGRGRPGTGEVQILRFVGVDDAGGSSTRCSRPASCTVGSPRASARRSGKRSSTTPTASSARHR